MREKNMDILKARQEDVFLEWGPFFNQALLGASAGAKLSAKMLGLRVHLEDSHFPSRGSL